MSDQTQHPSWDQLYKNIEKLEPIGRKLEAKRDVQMLELSRDIMSKKTGQPRPSVSQVQAYWAALTD